MTCNSSRQVVRDELIDEFLIGIGKKYEHAVVDCRLGFLHIPQSLPVYQDIDPEIAARRHFNDIKTYEDRDYETYEAALAGHKARREADCKRYQLRYGVDITDLKHYRVVVNSGDPHNVPQRIADKIIVEFKLLPLVA